MMKKSHLLIISLLMITITVCAGQNKLQKTKSTSPQDQKPSYNAKAVEHFIRGGISEVLNDYKTALLEYNEALLHDSSSATIYNKVAEAYIRLKKFDSAEKILNNAIRRFPDNIESYRLLAAIYYSQNQMGKAEQAYEKIIQLDPDNLESRYSLIALYLAQDKELKVAEEYEKIMEAGYGMSEMQIRVGDIYLKNKLFKKAEKVFNDFLNENPDDERAYLGMAKFHLTKLDTTTAIDWYKKAILTNPDFETCLEELRDLYIEQKKWDDAILLLNQVIARDTTKIENHLRLGELYYYRGDTTQAIEEFSHVIDRFPDDFRAYFSLGSLYYQSNLTESAEQYLKKAIEINKEFSRGWILLGFVYLHNQRLEDAENHFSQAIELFPDHPDINFFIGSVLNQRLKADEAIPYLEKSIQLKSNYYIDALGALAMIYDGKKIYHKSDSLYQAALKERPGDGLLMNNYSYSLTVRGVKLDEAMQMAQQAVAADSTNGAYLDTLGWIYFKQGDYQKALEYISRAVKYRDSSAEVMEHLGDVYEKLNDLGNARIYWQKALELDGNRTEVQKKLGEK
jgi:tetratricopeptide (TPR) repeat protein